MAKPIFEVQQESNSITIWEAGFGHRVIFPSETFAISQATILQTDERAFQKAKETSGVAVISKYGELVSPYEYLQRLFKAYRSKAAQYVGIAVHENLLTRSPQEFW